MRYVLRGGRLVPKESAAAQPASPTLVLDIKPFQSPIDGSLIGSRSALREHERRFGVRQSGNDWVGADDAPRPDWWAARRRS